MNLELTLNKMAKKHGFDFNWQDLKYDTRRAVIHCDSWNQLGYIKNALSRIGGVKIEDCTIYGGGVFDGYVYVMTAEESDRLRSELAAESKAHWDWWQRYHDADAETKRLMACGSVA